MIKLVGTSDKGEVLIVGLERGNWDRLLQGKPIHIELPGQMGVSWRGELMIIGAETRQDLLHGLSEMGILRDVPVKHFKEDKEQPS